MAIPSPVLVLTNQLVTGGAEVYVVTVSRWLAQQGVETIVAATPGELVPRLDPRVRYHPVPLRDVRLGLPLAVLRVRRLIRRHRPAAILCNSLVTAVVARLAGPRLPVVTVAHGWPEDRYRLVAPPMAVADRVVAVSDEVARRLKAGGLSERRIRVVRNGVDLTPFGPREADTIARARAEMGAGPDDVVVTNIGRYVPQKAQHHIVAIAAALKDRVPGLRFAIIGYGEREEELRRAIAAAGVEDRVRLLVRRPDVPDLLMGSDIYLNVADWEGMPLSMIEAMGASLPVVATDVEGMSALITPENGILCPPGDVASLTAAVEGLATDELRRLELGSVSRMRAEERFSSERMCADLAEVLAAAVVARA